VIHQQVITPRQTSRLTGVYFVWLADEWFLIAGQELPPESDYEDYPQIDNGVGSIRSSSNNFLKLLSSYRTSFSTTTLLTGICPKNCQGRTWDVILLPAVMSSMAILALDDMTVEEPARKLNTPILPVRGVEELIEICVSTTNVY